MPNCTDEYFFVSGESGCSLLFSALHSQGVDKGLPTAQVSTGFSYLSSVALFRWHHVQYEKAGITLFSVRGCCDAPWKKMSNHCAGNKKTERRICLGRLIPFSQCSDGWQPWCWVCVFVYLSGAKLPGTGANRKRPCPPTNEQHYSNGVFVVSALRCGPHTAVTGSIAWCTASSFWCTDQFIAYWSACGKIRHLETVGSSDSICFTVCMSFCWRSFISNHLVNTLMF